MRLNLTDILRWIECPKKLDFELSEPGKLVSVITAEPKNQIIFDTIKHLYLLKNTKKKLPQWKDVRRLIFSQVSDKQFAEIYLNNLLPWYKHFFCQDHRITHLDFPISSFLSDRTVVADTMPGVILDGNECHLLIVAEIFPDIDYLSSEVVRLHCALMELATGFIPKSILINELTTRRKTYHKIPIDNNDLYKDLLYNVVKGIDHEVKFPRLIECNQCLFRSRCRNDKAN